MAIRNIDSEDRLVQQGVADVFANELGWKVVLAYNKENFGTGSLLGRTDTNEVVLKRDTLAALQCLNPGLPAPAYQQALNTLLTVDTNSKDVVQLNEEKYALLKNGIPATYTDRNGEEQAVTLRVIDFNHPDNNTFTLVRELKISGQYGKNRRADLIGFVNGLPLVFIELKRYDKDLQEAYRNNYQDYRNESIPHLFHFNALVIFANGMEACYGSLSSGYEHFNTWKYQQDKRDRDPATSSVRNTAYTLWRGLCQKTVLLDMLENFTLFDRSEGEPARKILARNHQYLGVNAVYQRWLDNDADVQAGKLGVFWHTQGSGKSLSMVFLAEKIHRKQCGNFTFVIMTDRKELDGQIYTQFMGAGAATETEIQAKDGKGLKRLLQENHRYVFSLIHKFNQSVQTAYSKRRDIIVVSDEAHRSQNGDLAINMRRALPNAKFIGFTGTPLIAPKERELTRDTFGEYVSIYDFQSAVEDKATVPLYYENRGEHLKVVDTKVNETLQKHFQSAVESGELDEKQLGKLQCELRKEYQVLTHPTRLGKIADDVVSHYLQRRDTGKAMVVCLDRATCLRMYDLIDWRWQQTLTELQSEIAAEAELLGDQLDSVLGANYRRLQAKQAWMQQTQMRVVISEEQNEDAGSGDAMRLHRERMNTETLAANYKDKDHPFRIAIVCAMWLTGFDVKTLATLYLDKPMQGHTLMQAIARANRVSPGKKNGLIVDYNGVLQSLRAALSVYAKGESNTEFDPLQDKCAAIADYANSLDAAENLLRECGFDPQILAETDTRETRLNLIGDGENAVNSKVEARRRFTTIAQDVRDRWQGIAPDEGLEDYALRHQAVMAIHNRLQRSREFVDVSPWLEEFVAVAHSAMDVVTEPGAATDYQASKLTFKKKVYNISTIDFDRLHAEFAKSTRRHTAAASLADKLGAALEGMLAVNPSRINFYERYQTIVKAYNSDKDQVEIQRIFDELTRLYDDLSVEDRRYLGENLQSQQELAVFELLSKPTLNKAEREQVKQTAQALLERLERELLKIDRWKAKAQAKAMIFGEIKWVCDDGLPTSYDEREVDDKSQRVFSYVLECF
ncbi:type I restriction endonuclease subunit R [Thiothrix lacustris]|uniref:type I restriction endonuclease subunit R n=1 Tax=Thiothrix lacustris TaxID=525917 RepID=UPI0027E5BA0C|nr:type I restriction endonuclease subunit R [Thiothrix lacustris]WMP17370.1 type I restriction endonuclease subunit R [Thiothrix lacustris]